MATIAREKFINWGLLLLLGIIWGFSFILIKRGLAAFSPMQVGAIRISIAFISFLPLLFIVGIKVPVKRLPIVFFSAMLGSGMPPFLFAMAQSRISSGVAGILNSLTPFFALVAGYLFFKVSLKMHHLVGVLIGLTGAIIVILLRTDGTVEFNFGYSLLVILATAFYGTNANIIKTTLHDIHPVQIALVTFCFTGPLAATFLFTTDFVHVMQSHDLAWSSLGYLALLSVFGTSYSLILFNILAQRTSALFATMVTYIIPIVAMVVGLFDGEALGVLHVVGLFLILTGVYVSSIRKRKTEL